MQPPSTFDQALHLAVGAAHRRIDAVIALHVAKARAALAEGFYQDAFALRLSPEFLDPLKIRMEEAQFRLSMEPDDLDPEDPGFYVWESGHQFDDRGEEFSVNVLYRPQFWDYEVVRRDERGEQELGYCATYEAAMQCAREAIYPEPDEELPKPTITAEESDAAGDMRVQYQAAEHTVRDIVNDALKAAAQGCGQHYEIFARRARQALAELPHSMTTEEARAAMTNYIAYERY